MAKRRSKKQKQISALKRKIYQAEKLNKSRLANEYVEPIKEINENIINKEVLKKPSAKLSHTPKTSQKEDLFFYSSKLIKKDLRKTLILSFFFLALILVLYYILELNGWSNIQTILPIS